jgi:hypothetical protein
MTITFNAHTLPYRTDFFVAGARCFLSTNSHDVLRSAAQWRRTTDQNAAQSFAMQIIVEPSLDPIPGHEAHFRGARHLVFATLPPRSFIAIDLLRRRVYAVLSDAAAKDRLFWSTRLLPIAIGVLGTTFGVVPIHSACLDRNGSGVLIAGGSGAGKSTLATAMAQLGFSLLSDDWTYISKVRSTLVAHGLQSPLKLLPDAAAFFPVLREFNPTISLNSELAYEIDPAESIGVAVTSVSQPQSIVFLERTAAPGCYLLRCRPQYVHDFYERNAERLPDEIPEAKAFRSSAIKILSLLPAWIVRTGASPQATAEYLKDFLLEASRATA